MDRGAHHEEQASQLTPEPKAAGLTRETTSPLGLGLAVDSCSKAVLQLGAIVEWRLRRPKGANRTT